MPRFFFFFSTKQLSYQQPLDLTSFPLFFSLSLSRDNSPRQPPPPRRPGPGQRCRSSSCSPGPGPSPSRGSPLRLRCRHRRRRGGRHRRRQGVAGRGRHVWRLLQDARGQEPPSTPQLHRQLDGEGKVSAKEKSAQEEEKEKKNSFFFFFLSLVSFLSFFFFISLFFCNKKTQGSVADVGANDEQYIAVPLPESEALKAPRLRSEPRQFGYRSPGFSKPSSCSGKTYRAVVDAINASVAAGDLAVPSLARLGFHTCGTFSAIGYQGE